MSRISDYIRDNIVNKELDSRPSKTIGKVYLYNEKTHRANVGYTHPTSGAMIMVDDVTVTMESPGVKSRSLKAGDTVLLEFTTQVVPVIIKVIDYDYEKATRYQSRHQRKGAYIPDSICSR